MKRLPQQFFAREAAEVARSLIGCAIVHGDRAGMIVETEAYIGPQDRACHARFGPTARTSVMFGPAGRSYVYLCYGIHEMFNVVTGPDGVGQAVLVRVDLGSASTTRVRGQSASSGSGGRTTRPSVGKLDGVDLA
jgi:DNA-3-methyladenine glycosylase